MANQLFEFTVKVLRGDGCDMPEDMEGAYVQSYVGAPDFESALRKGVAALAGMHLLFDGIQGNVREIPLTSWGDYVLRVWPDFAYRMPSQEEVLSIVENGMVFFGPFAGFKHEG